MEKDVGPGIPAAQGRAYYCKGVQAARVPCSAAGRTSMITGSNPTVATMGKPFTVQISTNIVSQKMLGLTQVQNSDSTCFHLRLHSLTVGDKTPGFPGGAHVAELPG